MPYNPHHEASDGLDPGVAARRMEERASPVPAQPDPDGTRPLSDVGLDRLVGQLAHTHQLLEDGGQPTFGTVRNPAAILQELRRRWRKTWIRR